MSNSAPFTIDPQLTGIAIAYRNRQLIADEVLPRVQPVGTKQFSYTSFPQGEILTIPDTKVGRRGRPNVVEFSGTKLTSEAMDYGLEDEIPQDDIDQANSAINQALARPQERATEWLANLIALDREVRTAGVVFNPATYAAANKTQLVGGTQWSVSTVDPVAAIAPALEGVLMRPNVAVFGAMTWAALRRNPFIVKAVNKSSGDAGMVSRQDFAEVFELEEVLVGGAFYNTAKRGQAQTLSRAWGKHAAFIYRDKLADRERGVTFGMTVPYGERVAMQKPDSDIGLRGGVRVRVGETVKELITAPDAAYFFQDAVA
ncbi:phage capsid protein [Caulobacter sp. BP25]|uniref:phage capsid protein n=1 Tax=Caulobacter sp. BP25 TaxID=2048900 RepID=UPI000C12B298|nr:phage capsid protein [Caulobacter sp. BP25]PHY20810.1 phage capsid protein [Caulobacter sp. BP25]